jgi:Fe-S-cluster containining protein
MTTLTQLRSLNNEFNSNQQPEFNFPCLHCGSCCTRYKVRLSLGEARQICEGLGLSWYLFLGNYLEPMGSETENFYLRQQDGTCIFLKATDKPYIKWCLIQAWQPAACREWMPGIYRKECQEGLRKHWGLTVMEDGKLYGSGEQINQFKSFFRLADSNLPFLISDQETISRNSSDIEIPVGGENDSRKNYSGH